MFAGLAFWGIETVDKVMLRYLGGFAELGIYSIAIGIASVAGTLSIIFTTIWMPTAYRWANDADCAERIEAVAQKVVVGGSILISVTGTFTWTLGFLLPAEYASVQYLVCLCMVPPVLYAIAEVTGSGLGISRKSAPMTLITLIAGALNISINLALIPLLGAMGAAISTAVSFYLFFMLRSEAAMRCWHPMRRKPLYVPTASVTTTAILLTLIGPYYPNLASALWFSVLLFLVVANRKMLAELIDRLKAPLSPDPLAEVPCVSQIDSEKVGSKR
jgi:O-antigen/teichoic acid export membrane protein